MTIFAFGSVSFGRFEEHKRRWGRALHIAIVAAVFVTLSAIARRSRAYAVLALPLIGAADAHQIWLPKHGINGWTAKPRDKDLELIARRQRG